MVPAFLVLENFTVWLPQLRILLARVEVTDWSDLISSSSSRAKDSQMMQPWLCPWCATRWWSDWLKNASTTTLMIPLHHYFHRHQVTRISHEDDDDIVLLRMMTRRRMYGLTEQEKWVQSNLMRQRSSQGEESSSSSSSAATPNSRSNYFMAIVLHESEHKNQASK